MSAPDVRPLLLKGQPGAESASARAYVSPSRGLTFDASQLPAIGADRIYQLWVIAGKTPMGVGTFRPEADGSARLTITLPPGVTSVDAVAVTNEPGPNGSATPTLPILLIGQ